MEYFELNTSTFNKDLNIYYGQEESVIDKWKEIILIEDVNERHKAIDELLKVLNANSNNNGFIGPNLGLDIKDYSSCQIYIDDNELYYLFFDNLRTLYKAREQSENNYDDDNIINYAIINTLNQYFDGYGKDPSLRIKLTKTVENPSPSVKLLKGKGIAACVEVAACSHNLWILTGRTSYFVSTKNVHFYGTNDGHAYNIVNTKNKYILYDIVRKLVKSYKENPVDDIIANKSFVVNNEYYYKGKDAELTK